MRDHESPAKSLHPEWSREVAAIRQDFKESCGLDYTPSKVMNHSNLKLGTGGNPSCSDSGHWCDENVNEIMDQITQLKSRESLFDFVSDRLYSALVSNEGHYFWGVVMEAIFRTMGSDIDSFVEHVETILKTGKKLKYERLRNLLFLEFFKLKLFIAEIGDDMTSLSNLYSHFSADQFSDIYGQLGKLELRKTGKAGSASNDLPSFLHNEVFPIVIRDIPFMMMKKIAEESFDFELYPEELEQLWTCDLNMHIPRSWRENSAVHRWNESIMRVGGKSQTEKLLETSEALAPVYEAPWVQPTMSKPDTKPTQPLSRRSSAMIPARTLKMEGRRQSYKAADSSQLNGCLSIVHEPTEDGFFISRGVLDAMRDWQHDDADNSATMIPDKPLEDVIEELYSTNRKTNNGYCAS